MEDRAEHFFNEGVAFAQQGCFEDAIVSYDKSIAINPNDTRLWINRGVALSNLGRYTEAIKSYDKALALNPEYIEAMEKRGIALKKTDYIIQLSL